MGVKKQAVSQLAKVFAELGVKEVQPLPAFYQATEIEPEDPRLAAGISFLARKQPAAVVTLYFPEFNEQGFAASQRKMAVGFNVLSRTDFNSATKKIEKAFRADARDFEATALSIASVFFPAEPPPKGADLREYMPAAKETTTHGIPVPDRRRVKTTEITFDPKARTKKDKPLGDVVPVDKALKKAAAKLDNSIHKRGLH